jgi:hypothetical protein
MSIKIKITVYANFHINSVEWDEKLLRSASGPRAMVCSTLYTEGSHYVRWSLSGVFKYGLANVASFGMAATGISTPEFGVFKFCVPTVHYIVTTLNPSSRRRSVLWNLRTSSGGISVTTKPGALWIGHRVAATGAAVSCYLLIRLRNRDN